MVHTYFQGRCAHHVEEVRKPWGQSYGTVQCHGGGIGAFTDSLIHDFQFFHRICPEFHTDPAEVGDDIRCFASVEDHGIYMDIRGKTFSSGIYKIQKFSPGSQGAFSFPGRAYSVGGFSVEIYYIAPEAEHIHVRDRKTSCGTVHHGGQSHSVKDPLLGHADLGSVFFFGRCADDIEFSLERIFQFHKPQAGKNRKSPVKIMTAAVSDPRKSVIFYQKRGGRSISIVQITAECGIISCIRIGYLKAGFF